MVYLARPLLHSYFYVQDCLWRVVLENNLPNWHPKEYLHVVLFQESLYWQLSPPPLPSQQSVCTPHVLTSSSPITCLLLAHTLGSASGASGVGYKSVSSKEEPGLYKQCCQKWKS